MREMFNLRKHKRCHHQRWKIHLQRLYQGLKMQIIGHDLIKFEPIIEIMHLHELNEFDNVLFKFSETNIKAAIEMNKIFSVKTNDIDEILISNACGAKFIVVNISMAKVAQDLATYYLFDSKIAVIVDKGMSLNDLANLGVDVAIFKKGIKYGKI